MKRLESVFPSFLVKMNSPIKLLFNEPFMQDEWKLKNLAIIEFYGRGKELKKYHLLYKKVK